MCKCFPGWGMLSVSLTLCLWPVLSVCHCLFIPSLSKLIAFISHIIKHILFLGFHFFLSLWLFYFIFPQLTKQQIIPQSFSLPLFMYSFIYLFIYSFFPSFVWISSVRNIEKHRCESYLPFYFHLLFLLFHFSLSDFHLISVSSHHS